MILSIWKSGVYKILALIGENMFEPKLIPSNARFNRNTFAIIAAIILLLLSPFIYMYGSIIWDTLSEHYHRTAFDSAKWQDKGLVKSANPIRIRMVDDLLKQYSFSGMSREEVTEILGEPDKTAYFREWDMVYWLGPERSIMSIDSEWLVLRLDAERKVTECRIVTD